MYATDPAHVFALPRKSFFCLLIAVGCLAPRSAGATEYRLNPGSTIQTGCFPPCLCPLLDQRPLQGGFALAPVAIDPLYQQFAVSDIRWVVPSPSAADSSLVITGSGKYTLGGEFVLTHRLELDLQIGDQASQHFDSGVVVGGGDFPHVAIRVSTNGMICYDTVIALDASPAGACCLANAAGIAACIVTTREVCAREGGVYQGDGSTCPSDPTQPCGSPCPSLCPPGVPCFVGCGVIVQGAECPLFQAENGTLFVLANLGGFVVGDRVFVAGCVRPDCTTTCQQGAGCIENNTIAPCPRPCGGSSGEECPPDFFCKFPTGSCGDDANSPGVCAPTPEACPLYYDPVCGCDGVTYGNECEAAAAGVSVRHFGPCESPCRPTNDGFACEPTACNSPIPEVQCIPSVLHVDMSSGAIHVRACQCMDFNECHVEFGNASPFAVGNCPDNRVCEVLRFDSDGDGVADTFTAACVPAPIGACCLDIDDGPVGYDTCRPTDEQTCQQEGGLFAPTNTGCEDVQACCLTVFGTETFCVDLPRACCTYSGGVSRGPGSTCQNADNANPCGQLCGGIAGFPCPSAAEFCKLPDGNCCCDFWGVCTFRPNECPRIWDPVCGCDGVTYPNECEASRAGESIDHRGPCERFCNSSADCDSNDEFCWFPEGSCGGPTNVPGVCMPFPQVCPEVWDPVCGCDGSTYPNECLAAAAGVSIRHRGPCEVPCSSDEQCPALDQYCKFPLGTCGAPGTAGRCVMVPGGCPDVWDPVCGCDGNTYSNECDADAARVSVAHRGACDEPSCVATRALSEPDRTYCPGRVLKVQINLSLPAGAVAVAVEDVPPPGWSVQNISNDGSFDPVNGKVKWGPFFEPFPAELVYEAVPPSGAAGVQCFTGVIAVNGEIARTCGDECLAPCCRRLNADLPQPPCEACPMGDCAGCDSGACADGRITLCEVISYACAWLRGCNDDLAGMVRAAFIWRTGECYCWSAPQGIWRPTACPAPASGCCDDSSPPGSPGPDGGTLEGPEASAYIRLVRGSDYSRAQELVIPVTIIPPAGTKAAALELTVPSGWTVGDIRDGGRWDAARRKVKWGPFLDDQSRTVSFEVRRYFGRDMRKNRGTTEGSASVDVPSLAGFEGTVSFDGENFAIDIR